MVWQGKMNSLGLCSAILVIAIALAVLSNSENLTKFGAKGGGAEILAEMKGIQEDVYARLTVVKKLGVETAELATFAALQVGRFPPKDLQAQLLKSRDRIVSILREIGASQAEVENIQRRFNDRVKKDFSIVVEQRAISAVISAVNQDARSGKQAEFVRDTTEAQFHRMLESYGASDAERRNVLQWLRERKAEIPEVVSALDELDYFVKTGGVRQ